MRMIVALFGPHWARFGRSSGVERNLAKVEVVSSNLITRSNFPQISLSPVIDGLFACLGDQVAKNNPSVNVSRTTEREPKISTKKRFGPKIN